MPDAEELASTLESIDGRGYKAYKSIAGEYVVDDRTLAIDHVQGDPYAHPSKVRMRISREVSAIPADLSRNRVRRMALEDVLARVADEVIREVCRGDRGSGRSGLVSVGAGEQEVLERTAAVATPEHVELRLYAGLPARGRTVRGLQARAMLLEELPEVADRALRWDRLDGERIRRFVECVENQEAIRGQLDERDLVAFVADGSLLPRESGASDRPLDPDRAVPFTSPDSLRVTFEVPNEVDGPDGPTTEIRGMGVPPGVTLIVGGGYHGKSTLLQALERGVYPHVPGDGREGVVTVPDAVKIRAEDGRRVESVDIGGFIADLPGGQRTDSFSSDDASGSTSQAAAIVEALEVGTSLLLLDEDTSATNFMVRDARMQALVAREDEPITPFLDRVRELSTEQGVSTVLVMGGSGDYFEVADTVIQMREFRPVDVTGEARSVASDHPTGREVEVPGPMRPVGDRVPRPETVDASKGKRDVRIRVHEVDRMEFGRHRFDLGALEQLVDRDQTRAVGHGMVRAAGRLMGEGTTLREVVEGLDALFDEEGLDFLSPWFRPGEHPGNFARPRPYEVAAALNRLRPVRLVRANGGRG